MDVSKLAPNQTRIIFTKEERMIVNRAILDKIIRSAEVGNSQYEPNHIFLGIAKVLFKSEYQMMQAIATTDKALEVLASTLSEYSTSNQNNDNNDIEEARSLADSLYDEIYRTADLQTDLEESIQLFEIPNNLEGLNY